MRAAKSILISLILGIVFGGIIRNTHLCVSCTQHLLDVLVIVSDIFIKLIKMIIAPLIFATLTLGVINIGSNAKKDWVICFLNALVYL